MKWISSIFLAAILMGAGAPVMHAVQSTTGNQHQNDNSDRERRRRRRLPEGSGGVIAALTVGAVGGGLLIWRKKRASVA